MIAAAYKAKPILHIGLQLSWQLQHQLQYVPSVQQNSSNSIEKIANHKLDCCDMRMPSSG